MMKNLMAMILFLVGGLFLTQAQSIVGKWKTVDDQTGEAKSIVEITEKNGKFAGKVIEILNPAKKNSKCDNCSGEDKGKPIEGLVIIKNLEKKEKNIQGVKLLILNLEKSISVVLNRMEVLN